MNAANKDSATEQQVAELIAHAVSVHCSDIHLEPCPQYYIIRLRCAGQLRRTEQIDLPAGRRMVGHIKVLGALDLTERRLPQDGRCRVIARGQQIECRISTLPTLHGEKVVLRLLPFEATQRQLPATGLNTAQQNIIRQMLSRHEGLILTTGPTGSGKTQTLYTLLSELNQDSRNISTVEDPVEVALPGVNQLNVQPGLGLTFAVALRALMRQDPDIIMVGEIRDTETAAIACQAAQTGHLVLATLHAASALSALIRLSQLGVNGYQLAACLLLLMNQRLVNIDDNQRHGVFTLTAMNSELRYALLANAQHPRYWQQIARCIDQQIDQQSCDEKA